MKFPHFKSSLKYCFYSRLNFPYYNNKVKPRTNHEGPEGKQMYSTTLPSTSALVQGFGAQRNASGRFTPREKKTRYPLYRRLGGPQGRSGRVWKISPPTGIRSPDLPARSESLYRLSYPGPKLYTHTQTALCVIIFISHFVFLSQNW